MYNLWQAAASKHDPNTTSLSWFITNHPKHSSPSSSLWSGPSPAHSPLCQQGPGHPLLWPGPSGEPGHSPPPAAAAPLLAIQRSQDPPAPSLPAMPHYHHYLPSSKSNHSLHKHELKSRVIDKEILCCFNLQMKINIKFFVNLAMQHQWKLYFILK